MGTVERRARHKESLRQEILSAAGEILIEEGLNQLSMRRIAERIEYTPTTIYLYFKDKGDLLFHLCEEVFGRVAEAMESAGSGIKDPVACVRAMMRSYIDFGLSQPDRYRIAFMTDVASGVDPTRFTEEGARGHTAFELLRRRVGDAIGEGRSIQEAEATTQTVWALSHGIVSLLINYPVYPWAERETLIEKTMNLVTAALSSRSPVSRWEHE